MAKIHKISGYVVDIDETFGVEDLKYALDVMEFFTQQLHVETANIGEWDDDNPLNYLNCDLAECEKYFPKASTVGTRKVEIGAIYRHFKGHEVKVLAIAKDTENVAAYSVIYEHLEYGDIWSRPYDMFISEVDHAKYPNVEQKYRFEKVEE